MFQTVIQLAVGSSKPDLWISVLNLLATLLDTLLRLLGL